MQIAGGEIEQPPAGLRHLVLAEAIAIGQREHVRQQGGASRPDPRIAIGELGKRMRQAERRALGVRRLAVRQARPHRGLHQAMNGDGWQFGMLVLDQRHAGERHQRFGPLVLVGDGVRDQVERNVLRRKEGETPEQRFGLRMGGDDLLDREPKGGGDARRVDRAGGGAGDPRVDLLMVAVEARSGQPAIGTGMIERKRKVAERRCQPRRSRRVGSSGALLQELDRGIRAEQVELHLDRAPHPVGPAAGDEDARTGRRNQIA